MRELHVRRSEGLGLRVQVDREVADRFGRLADEDLAASAGAIDQPQPQAARIDSLRDHEALALLEIEREGDLPGRHGVDPGGGDDVRAAGYRRGFRQQLRQLAHAAVGHGRELNMHLPALARGQAGDEAHRAIEHHGQVDLVLVVVHLDDVHQARRPAHGKLRKSAARAERGEQNERQAAQPALSDGTSHPTLDDAVRADFL